MLLLHIDTKTTDPVFHRESEKFYEVLFDVAHQIGEKYVDLWGNLSNISLEEKKNRAYELIRQIKQEIEEYHKNNEVTLGTEDLLGSLANSLEDIEWSAKGFIK